jgi:hypothetical protein
MCSVPHSLALSGKAYTNTPKTKPTDTAQSVLEDGNGSALQSLIKNIIQANISGPNIQEERMIAFVKKRRGAVISRFGQFRGLVCILYSIP